MKRADLDMIEQEMEMRRSLERMGRAEPKRADLALRTPKVVEQANEAGNRFFRNFEKGSFK